LDQFFSSIRLSVGGVDLGLGGAISLYLVSGALLYSLDLKFKDSQRLRLPIIWLYFIFCLVNCAVFFYSDDKPAAAKVLLRLFSIFSILILTALAVESKFTARSLIRAILFSAAIPVGWGFMDYLLYGSHLGRFAGTFSHPNILAFYLLIIIGCLMFQLDNDKRLVEVSWKRVSILLILIIVLILTETRSGWGAFLLMTAIYITRFNKRLLFPAFILIIVLAFIPLVQNKITNSFSFYGNEIYVNKESSLGWRIEQWKAIFESAMERPILGHGIQSDFSMGIGTLGAHNDYLKYFAESGITGLIAAYIPYIYLLISSLKRLCRREHDISEASYKLAAFIVCFIPAFLLMSITENLADYVIVHWYLWALIGIYFALDYIHKAGSGAGQMTKESNGT
jgi:O-antigen ligase